MSLTAGSGSTSGSKLDVLTRYQDVLGTSSVSKYSPSQGSNAQISSTPNTPNTPHSISVSPRVSLISSPGRDPNSFQRQLNYIDSNSMIKHDNMSMAGIPVTSLPYDWDVGSTRHLTNIATSPHSVTNTQPLYTSSLIPNSTIDDNVKEQNASSMLRTYGVPLIKGVAAVSLLALVSHMAMSALSKSTKSNSKDKHINAVPPNQSHVNADADADDDDGNKEGNGNENELGDEDNTDNDNDNELDNGLDINTNHHNTNDINSPSISNHHVNNLNTRSVTWRDHMENANNGDNGDNNSTNSLYTTQPNMTTNSTRHRNHTQIPISDDMSTIQSPMRRTSIMTKQRGYNNSHQSPYVNSQQQQNQYKQELQRQRQQQQQQHEYEIQQQQHEYEIQQQQQQQHEYEIQQQQQHEYEMQQQQQQQQQQQREYTPNAANSNKFPDLDFYTLTFHKLQNEYI